MKRFKMRGGLATRFMICIGISAAVILLFSLIGAIIASSLEDPTRNIGIISLCVMLSSAAVSGFFSSIFAKDKRLSFPSLLSLFVVLVMLLINVIISGGKVSGGAFMNYGCYYGVFILVAFLSGGEKRKRKHR